MVSFFSCSVHHMKSLTQVSHPKIDKATIGMGANGVFQRQNNDVVVPKDDPRTMTSEPGTMENRDDALRLLA